MVGELLVFNARQRWVTSETKAYKVRRPHTKSRSGCKTCKIRRVKCDEDRPRCAQCRRRGMICAYQGDDRPPLPLWPGRKTPPVLANDPSEFTTEHDLDMLHHFIEVVGPNMYDRKVLDAHAIDIWSLARSVPHVMHAVLAASALHLNATSTTPTYSIIETGHWVHASSSFRTALPTMTHLTNPDPLLTTCMLLNLLSFANVNTHAPIRTRWPLALPTPHSPDPLQWFRVQLGVTPLLTDLGARTQGKSIWLPLFLASNYSALYDERDGDVDIPRAYCDLFSITPTSNIDEHTYLRLVRRITLLRSIYDATERETPGEHDLNAMKYLQFMQGVDLHTLELLTEKDPRTLLLYLYFMAMLCSIKHWWCWPRAKAECGAVVRYLDETHGGWLGREGWLDWPAGAVGYELTWRERGGEEGEGSWKGIVNGEGVGEEWA